MHKKYNTALNRIINIKDGIPLTKRGLRKYKTVPITTEEIIGYVIELKMLKSIYLFATTITNITEVEISADAKATPLNP